MLYIIATPIGNLKDISARALEILRTVDIIACEDTRVTQKLCQLYGIKPKKLIALHSHNEAKISQDLIKQLEQDSALNLALVSDAGTPLISDPGAKLVELAHANKIKVSSLPGASAVTVLLSALGFNSSSFNFYGFLPSKSSHRLKLLTELYKLNYNCNNLLVFFEAPHRIIASLVDIIEIFGPDLEIGFGRELTKQFETIKRLPAAELLSFVKSDSNQQRGEIGLVIANLNISIDQEINPKVIEIIKIIMHEAQDNLPVKTIAKIVAEITGVGKNKIYQYIQAIK